MKLNKQHGQLQLGEMRPKLWKQLASPIYTKIHLQISHPIDYQLLLGIDQIVKKNEIK